MSLFCRSQPDEASKIPITVHRPIEGLPCRRASVTTDERHDCLVGKSALDVCRN
jgi:hypothetical protein